MLYRKPKKSSFGPNYAIKSQKMGVCPPTAASSRRSTAGEIQRYSSSIDAAKWQRITELCCAEGLTPSSLLFACYCSILATWSSTKQFTMNVALFGRDTDLHAEAANLVGNLSSTMLVPVDVSPKAAPSLRALCKVLYATTLNTMNTVYVRLALTL